MMKHYQKMADTDDWYLAMLQRKQLRQRVRQRRFVLLLDVFFLLLCGGLVLWLLSVGLQAW